MSSRMAITRIIRILGVEPRPTGRILALVFKEEGCSWDFAKEVLDFLQYKVSREGNYVCVSDYPRPESQVSRLYWPIR